MRTYVYIHKRDTHVNYATLSILLLTYPLRNRLRLGKLHRLKSRNCIEEWTEDERNSYTNGQEDTKDELNRNVKKKSGAEERKKPTEEERKIRTEK